MITEEDIEMSKKLDRVIVIMNSALLSLGFDLKTREGLRIYPIIENKSILTIDYANYIMAEANKAYHVSQNVAYIEPCFDKIMTRTILTNLYMNMIRSLMNDPNYLRTSNKPILLEDIEAFSMNIHMALFDQFI